jgi:hypothetical protein
MSEQVITQLSETVCWEKQQVITQLPDTVCWEKQVIEQFSDEEQVTKIEKQSSEEKSVLDNDLIIGLDQCDNQGLEDIYTELEGSILMEEISKYGKDPIEHILYNDRIDKDIRDSLKQKIERAIADTLKDLNKYRPNKKKEIMQFINTIAIQQNSDSDCCKISLIQEENDEDDKDKNDEDDKDKNDEDQKKCKVFSLNSNNVKYNVIAIENAGHLAEKLGYIHYDIISKQQDADKKR